MGEWTGPWSDGAKEWTDNLEILKEICHEFGNDGQFVMECELLDVFSGVIYGV